MICKYYHPRRRGPCEPARTHQTNKIQRGDLSHNSHVWVGADVCVYWRELTGRSARTIVRCMFRMKEVSEGP